MYESSDNSDHNFTQWIMQMKWHNTQQFLCTKWIKLSRSPVVSQCNWTSALLQRIWTTLKLNLLGNNHICSCRFVYSCSSHIHLLSIHIYKPAYTEDLFSVPCGSLMHSVSVSTLLEGTVTYSIFWPMEAYLSVHLGIILHWAVIIGFVNSVTQ